MKIWASVLQALLLTFHGRGVPPLATDDDKDDRVDCESVIPAPAMEALRQFAEWGVSRWISDYRYYPWEDRGSAPANAPAMPQRLSERVISAIDNFLSTLNAARNTNNWKALREQTLSFSRPTSSDPAEFDKRVAWEAVEDELSAFGLNARRESVTFIPRVDEADSWGYKVTASGAVLANVLHHIRAVLADRLPALDGTEYSSADGPGTAGMFCIGMAVVARAVVECLQRDLEWKDRVWDTWVDAWVIELLHPSWRRCRDWIGGAQPRRRVPAGRDWIDREGLPRMEATFGFREFLREYFSIIKDVLHVALLNANNFSWEQRYSVPGNAWDSIQERDPDLRLHLTRSDVDGHLIGGSFGDYVALFDRAAERLLLALPKAESRLERSGILEWQAGAIIESAVDGSFVPAGAVDVDSDLLSWATRQEIPQQSVLPATSRVLYCTRPGRSQERLRVRRLLRMCVLLHEHFHAIIETGSSWDVIGTPGLADASRLSSAIALNESLAVWVEWHYVRQHGGLRNSACDVDEVKRALWAYIRCGDYPNWPYRGAERIESMYSRDGIGSVRSLIYRLRADPVSAQHDFDNWA